MFSFLIPVKPRQIADSLSADYTNLIMIIVINVNGWYVVSDTHGDHPP